MSNYPISCRQRITLYHSYYNTFPIDIKPSSASNITEAILYTIFILNNNYGSTQNDLIAKMNIIFPQYATSTICNVITTLLKNGALITLNPVLRNWCIGGYGCEPNSTISKKPVGLTINPNIDQKSSNNGLVSYLIGLSGGTRAYSYKFNMMFNPYVNPSPNGIGIIN